MFTEKELQILNVLKDGGYLDPEFFTLTEEDKADGIADVSDKLFSSIGVEGTENYKLIDLFTGEDLVVFLNDQGISEYFRSELENMDDDVIIDMVAEYSHDFKDAMPKWGIQPEKVGDYQVARVKRAGLWSFIKKRASFLKEYRMSTTKKAAKGGIGNYRRGEVLMDVTEVSPGQLLVLDSIKYKVVNLIKVTQTFKDKFYAVFVKPDNPNELQSKGDEEFAVRTSDLPQGEYYVALEPSPTETVPEEKVEETPPAAPATEGKPEATPEAPEASEKKPETASRKTAAREVYLDSAEDISWLFDTHLKEYPQYKTQTGAVILFGNEDAPEKVDLFFTSEPKYDDVPDKTFISDDNEDLKEALTASKKTAGYHGTYSELEYTIYDQDGDEVYTAGNSPLDSQGYVSAEEGVGRDQMRENCEITGKELADDAGLEWGGSDYEAPETLAAKEKTLNSEWVNAVELPNYMDYFKYSNAFADVGIACSHKKENGKHYVRISSDYLSDPETKSIVSEVINNTGIGKNLLDSVEAAKEKEAAKKTADNGDMSVKFLDFDQHMGKEGGVMWEGSFSEFKEVNADAYTAEDFAGMEKEIQEKGETMLGGGAAPASILRKASLPSDYTGKKLVTHDKLIEEEKKKRGLTEASTAAKKTADGDVGYWQVYTYDIMDGEVNDVYKSDVQVSLSKDATAQDIITDLVSQDFLTEKGGKLAKNDESITDLNLYQFENGETGAPMFEVRWETALDASKKEAMESPVRKQRDYGECPFSAEERKERLESKLQKLNSVSDTDLDAYADSGETVRITLGSNQTFTGVIEKPEAGRYFVYSSNEAKVNGEAPLSPQFKEEDVTSIERVSKAGKKTAATPKEKASVYKERLEKYKEKYPAAIGAVTYFFFNWTGKDYSNAFNNIVSQVYERIPNSGDIYTYASGTLLDAEGTVSGYLWDDDYAEVAEEFEAILSSLESGIDSMLLENKEASKKTAEGVGTGDGGGGDEPAVAMAPPDANPITVSDPDHATPYSRYSEDTKTADVEEEKEEDAEEKEKEPTHELVSVELDEDMAQEPSDDDITIDENAGPLGGGPFPAFYAGKQIAKAADLDTLATEIAEWMEKHQYWPSVWGMGERGNLTPYAIQKKGAVDNFEIEEETPKVGEYSGIVGSTVSSINRLFAGTETLASAPGSEGDDGSAYDLLEGDRNFTGVDEDMVTSAVDEYLTGKALTLASFEDFCGYISEIYGVEKEAAKEMHDAWYGDDARALTAFVKKNATQDLLK